MSDEDSSHARIEIVVAMRGSICRGHHELLLLGVGEAEVGDLAVVADLKGLVVHVHKANTLNIRIC